VSGSRPEAVVPYQPTIRRCLDCDAPYYDAGGDPGATRCGVCELKYQVQLVKLRVYLGTPAKD
jgi:hypothetical protein